MKQQIYQNGFYLMIGLIFGSLVTLISVPKQHPIESTIKIELVKDSVKDSVKITPKETSQFKKVLNEENLKAELKRHNIPHSDIVLAQAKLESGLGTSKVYRRTNNLFGLKKGNKYRAYSHWTECVKDYKRCISNRYKGGSYYAFLDRIGYASAPDYTETLRKMV